MTAAAARRSQTAIPAAPRKTLLEWIELDDGDTPSTRPHCSAKTEALHARIALTPQNGKSSEPLQPPAGLRLAPLG